MFVLSLLRCNVSLTFERLFYWPQSIVWDARSHLQLIAIQTLHRCMAYTAFWTKAHTGRKKIFQKEPPVMVMKPSLSIHIEFYIIYPFPNNNYWRTFFSFFYLRKDTLPDFSLLGFKRKIIWIWKRKNFWGRRKKSLLIRPWRRIRVLV